MWRGEAWRGRAGQAFELGEPGVADGTTANSLAADRRGPRQDDQVAKTKLLRRELLADSGPEPGANASPLFKEPAAWNSPARWPGWLKGGLDIPATHAECGSLHGNTRSGR